MSNPFVWDSEKDQTYLPDNASQVLSQSAFNKSKQKSFTMEAPHEELILRPSVNLSWYGPVKINAGKLLVDCQRKLYFETISDIFTGNGLSVIEIYRGREVSFKPDTNTVISKNGMLLINEAGILEMDGSFRVQDYGLLQCRSTFRTNGEGNGIVSLENDSRFESFSPEFTDVKVVCQDSSFVFIAANSINVDLMNNSLYPALINLSAGTSLVHVCGYDGDSTALTPAPLFNFITSLGDNKSVLELNFTFTSNDAQQSGANGFGRSWLLSHGLIMINGVPQSDETKLIFDFGSKKGVMIIKLK